MIDTFTSTVDIIPDQLLFDALAQTVKVLYERIGHKNPSAITEEKVLGLFPEFVGIRTFKFAGEVINLQNIRHSHAPALKQRVEPHVAEYIFMYQVWQEFYPETQPTNITRFQNYPNIEK